MNWRSFADWLLNWPGLLVLAGSVFGSIAWWNWVAMVWSVKVFLHSVRGHWPWSRHLPGVGPICGRCPGERRVVHVPVGVCVMDRSCESGGWIDWLPTR
jgi:hypothetical protein